MHIVDGVLSTPVLVAGSAATLAGVSLGLRQLTLDRIPVAGMLSASFFVASLINVPLGPSSVHLLLNGMAGMLLGWAAFPAMLVGLILQAAFFGFGGLTVLGVNAFNLAAPGVIAWLIFAPLVRRASPKTAAIWGGLGSAFAVTLTTVFVAMSLALSGNSFIAAAKLVLLAHLPLVLIEGVLTGFAVLLARKVKPELFAALKGRQ